MKKTSRKLLLVAVFLAVVSVPSYFLLFDEGMRTRTEIVETKGVSLDRSIGGAVATESEEVEIQDGGEFYMEAVPVRKMIGGKEVSMYSYNGQMPGPTLKVKQGSSLTINFKNGLSVDTTVHWHGIRVENKFDGVPGVTQIPVGPGESFAYKLRFPDAGIYWYHPHVREDFQQELGLYGGIIVEPTNPGYYNPVDREEVLMLDDIRMRNGDVDFFSEEYANYALMGRFGNMMLTNGDDDYVISTERGEKIRFYVVDAANTRVFNFSIEGQKMVLVGDDSGRYERDVPTGGVVVSPSERRIIEVKFGEPGSFKILHRTPESEYVLGRVEVSNAKISEDGPEGSSLSPDIRGGVVDFEKYANIAPDIEMRLLSELSGMMARSGGGMMAHTMSDGSVMGGSMMGDSGPIEWEDDMFMMNAMSNSDNTKWVIKDSKTGRENDGLTYEAGVGDVKKVRIFNDPNSMHPMQHPIHLHGQRFLVLSEDGVQNKNLAWKDTVLVKKGSTVDLLVDFTNPGDWIVHCHIPEHMESGMMAKFEVSA